MTLWSENPATAIEQVFGDIARDRMADFPLVNAALSVEAVACRRHAPSGEAAFWVGVLITPWAMNLMLLPASDGDAPWPDVAPGGKHLWRFPSGVYEFTVAEADGLGVYHLCSLFSPPLDFPDQATARQTAYATLAALLREDPLRQTAESSGRRRFGFSGKRT
ncbi:MAG: [NiFe]-hydrogenase assembly chaperone HybE [Zoogloeaceae bacterium]|jgi:[NiFe] hydrogenase assembly HybE family chaperone|nr:[NiFe]-hydrogenase assembly chaperone HybE [Zoogloeaceae bacterium]